MTLSRRGDAVEIDHFGLPQRRVRGGCRICGEVHHLTFEHIPPKSAGNNQTVRSVPLDRWITDGAPGQFPRHGWTQQQKGTGGYVLCGRCNNFTGRHYVPDFVEFANAAIALMAREGIWTLPDVAADASTIEFTAQGIRPGVLARQVLTMLLAVSGSPEVAAQRPLTRRIILEDYPAALSDLRMFMTLYRGPGIRVLPTSAMFSLAVREPQTVVEVAFPPFAFVGLLSGPADPKFGAEISDWTELPSPMTANVLLRPPIASGHTPFPADYRSLTRINLEAGR